MSIFLILAALLFSAGCNKTETVISAGLIIKAGFVCGWGSGLDSLNITQTAIYYRYWVPGTSPLPVINKSRIVSESEWEEILSDVNMDEFIKLNYQSCNVCVDGCDEWISIRNDKLFHEITFDKGLKIDRISKLQDKLAELRAEFGN